MVRVVHRYLYKKTACKELPKYITKQAKEKKKSWRLFSDLMTKTKKKHG